MPVAPPERPFLTHPYLLAPRDGEAVVAWCTSERADRARVIVGDGEYAATSHPLSRAADDAYGRVTTRQVWRHVARVRHLAPGRSHRYAVEVTACGATHRSPTFELRATPRDGAPARLLLTSDHQLFPNAAHCMELAAATLGDVDAVVFSGDLVNVPDRALEWFEHPHAFFRTMQGWASAVGSRGRPSVGAPLLQRTPIIPCIGNHEVQGAVAAHGGLSMSAVPRDVALAHCPTHLVDPERRRWIEDHSWSLTTFDELFGLPWSAPPRWHATTIGNIRLITLFHTRMWRGFDADPDPAQRTHASRYQEASSHLDDPLRQGHGCHLFSDIAPGSEQYTWLAAELASQARHQARYTVVQLHEGALGWGGNVEPPFCEPERIEEYDDGHLVGIRYEYSQSRNAFYHDVMPLLERAGVDLVISGHSHCWGRFTRGGTQYLEASNVGRSHGIHDGAHPRPVPPAPWRTDEYRPVGDPHGTPPAAQPWGDSDVLTFTLFDGAAGALECWRCPVDDEPELFDRVEVQASS